MSDTQTLYVLLKDQPVGILTLDNQERCEFRMLDSYKKAYPRPILGQVFVDNPDQIHRSRSRVPPWFSNLLPEGPLRELIAQQAGVTSIREFYLLQHLGEDLPGAVRIIAEEPLPRFDALEIPAPDKEATENTWHFSLAGVQLKFSAQRQDRGLTIPATGQGGNWIVKLPDSRFPLVPENEWSTMRWAAASGIRIPEIELVKNNTISGLPESLSHYTEQHALAIKRFDRPDNGQRIHMEDFAQILNLYPEEKYAKYNYETLAKLILALTGEDGLHEYLHRLVFIIASGNGDAHHKNWSLLYPDSGMAELSPAYDLVSTIQYMPNESLALNLAKSKQWQDIKLESFLRMARKIGVDEDWIFDCIEYSIEQTLDAWHKSEDKFGYDEKAQRIIDRHLQEVPLISDLVK